MSWFNRFWQSLHGEGKEQPPASSPSSVDNSGEYTALTGTLSNVGDALYVQAVEFVYNSKETSISRLQYHLKVGYNRAALLIEAMEFDGIVSSVAANGGRRLLSQDERIAYLSSREVKRTSSNSVVEQNPNRRRALPSPEKSVLPPLTGTIRGTKNCGFNIVGESHYQAGLRMIRNSRCMAEDNDFEAYIVTEPDNPHDVHACAVYIEGHKVGYLSRDDAANYVEQMKCQGVHGVSCFKLRAKLVGGFGDRLNIGVLVNLPKQ